MQAVPFRYEKAGLHTQDEPAVFGILMLSLQTQAPKDRLLLKTHLYMDLQVHELVVLPVVNAICEHSKQAYFPFMTPRRKDFGGQGEVLPLTMEGISTQFPYPEDS